MPTYTSTSFDVNQLPILVVAALNHAAQELELGLASFDTIRHHLFIRLSALGCSEVFCHDAWTYLLSHIT